MVLALRHTCRPMEQNRESRNKSMHIWSTDLRQGCQEYTMGKDYPSTSVAGKTGCPHAK